MPTRNREGQTRTCHNRHHSEINSALEIRFFLPRRLVNKEGIQMAHFRT